MSEKTGRPASTVNVILPDSMGRTVEGSIMAPADWPEWAAKRVEGHTDRGVAVIGGRVYVIRWEITKGAILWKSVG